ncbi:hypothetical protein ABZT03_43135 [Streptomyces sp. NPDC005574]|uniref:hypothetical protein n=1 Tax=Streptomyces sp. NPDC005574 TaxID=3156891 RepID=UPI0033A5E2C7
MQQPVATSCDHHYETRILGGHPISVRLCALCRTPDWSDLYEQADVLFHWGRGEGLAGKPPRDRLSAYDMPRDDPAAVPAAVSPPATDRAAWRERIVNALYDVRRPGLGGMTEAGAVARMAGAVLAALPAPTDRAAVLADVMAMIRKEIHDCGYPLDAGCDFCNGVTTVLEKVRRLADETPASEKQDAEAHPPHDSWLVQVHLPDVDGWHVAYPTTDKPKALDRLKRGRRETPDREWRLVRETTSYAVVQPAEPASGETPCSARPCNPAADELCDNHARIHYHAEGEHAFCEPECTTEAQQDGAAS